MAGAACKVVINNGVRALIDGVERILLDSDIHQDKIPHRDRMVLVQRLADIDIAAFTGDASLLPAGGVIGIVNELQEYGLITDEVWRVFNRGESQGGSQKKKVDE